jgi:hypothetical protein
MATQATLTVSVLFALIAAGIYAYVGWRLSRRVIPAADSRLAWRFFTVWWYGLAASALIGGLLNLLGALQTTNLALFVTVTYFNLQISCVALLGLFYYLIYLYTGNSRWLTPLAIFYTLAYVLLVYYVTSSEPVSVALERWGATLVYRTPLTGPFIVILVALLFASQILGGFVYFRLYFRVQDVTQKYRILLVSWSIIVWFLIPFVGIAAGLEEADWWQIFSRLLGLAAAWTSLMAYWPPRWLKQRFQILSLADETREG